MDSEKKVVWFAACDGVSRMGPYDSQVRAWQSLLSAPMTNADITAHERHGVKIPRLSLHVKDSYVWPEYES